MRTWNLWGMFMSEYAKQTTVSPEKSRAEIETILRRSSSSVRKPTSRPCGRSGGLTVAEAMLPQLEAAYKTGEVPRLMPMLPPPKPTA